MSVVSHQARRRWAVVAAGVAVLMCLPAVTSSATAWVGGRSATVTPPRDLLTRARDSASVAHEGLAESRGSLGLPDLTQTGDVAELLGGTTRTRVWWKAADAWRVDVVSTTGEQGTYGGAGVTSLWDYEQEHLTTVVGESPVRLPRADDLLPPQAARRLLSGVGPRDAVTGLPERRIAGTQTEGIRIVPADPRSTLGHIDVFVEPSNGLPVSLTVVDTDGRVALESHFVDLDLNVPDAAALRTPAAPGAEREVTQAPDLASQIYRYGNQRLPQRLAGFRASAPVLGGTATYGTGLVRFVVLPIPQFVVQRDRILDGARAFGAVRGDLHDAESLTLSGGAVNVVFASSLDRRRTYVVAGLVDTATLVAAANQLYDNPPRLGDQ